MAGIELIVKMPKGYWDLIKDLSKRVEILEKQMKENQEKEEQLKKLKAELDYAKFRCALYATGK